MGEVRAPQSYFFAETTTSLASVIDYEEGEFVDPIDFRSLLQATRRTELTAEWEAFDSFTSCRMEELTLRKCCHEEGDGRIT